MLESNQKQLKFSFPEVHSDASCTVTFQRTLRIPDDNKTYPLPPGLGNFPLRSIENFKEKFDEKTLKRGGVMLPMYQSEALWIQFSSNSVNGHGTNYPFAVKIGAGKRSAITAEPWYSTLKENDYVVLPKQPWIDGFLVEKGVIRQFVAAPLGMGFTVEEQLTKEVEFGGIQIEVFPMKKEEFERRFPKKPIITRQSLNYSSDCFELDYERAAVGASPARSMGMAAGGKMKQEIYPDPYGLQVWDLQHKSRTFVHLMNSLVWKSITGEECPTVPTTAKDYNRYGLPWFEYYSEGGSLNSTGEAQKIKSVQQMAVEKGFTILPENETVDPKTTVIVSKDKNFDGDW